MDFIFDPSLVLYLPLYELDGASFISKDANGHLCTVTGALWRPNGHYFDGTDDKIDCGAGTNLAVANEITIEAWINPESLGEGSAGRILSKNDIANYAYLPIVANNSIAIYFGSTQYPSDASVFTLNTWQHFAVTFNKPVF